MNIHPELSSLVDSNASLSLLGLDEGNPQCNLLNCGSSSNDVIRTAKLSALAGIRLVTSLLSILGAMSIIISVIFKRQVRSPKVHPIFMLSIADSLLAVLWVAGGIIYLGGISKNKVVCLFVSLLTVILECVTINLTFVYALFAHAHIKQTNLCTILTSFNRPDHGWPLRKVFAVYFMAWVLPIMITVLPFGGIASTYDMIDSVEQCSCGCIPRFANIEPTPPWTKNTSQLFPANVYRMQLKKLVVTYTAIIATHYLIVFPLLVIYYCRILHYIKKLKQVNDEQREGHSFYGAAALILRGHSQAKQRVILFLTIFIINGFCNLVLAMVLMIHLSVELIKKDFSFMDNSLKTSLLGIALVQSITVPLQGFLNAIVYGWTREDFLYIMVSSSRQEHSTNNYFSSNYINAGEISDHDESTFFENSEQYYSPGTRSRQNTPESHSRGPSGTYDFSQLS